jgi:hypothetical protein
MTELEALWKKLREDTQWLEEEMVTLLGMVVSHDELIMEIARETGLDRMGEDAEDDEEDAWEKMLLHPLFLCPLLPQLKRSMMKALWR